MPDQPLNPQERTELLTQARLAIEAAVSGKPMPSVDWNVLSETLLKPGASFVTLTRHGQLHGCIGALEPYQPLIEDVREHAAAAATQDYRFSPLRLTELPEIVIEISRLTQPVHLEYENPDDLIKRLRPGIDGVVLRDGYRRSTFLPQVWEKIPDPAEFLSNLCYKMGAAPDLWRQKKLEVDIYQVEEFHE